MIILSPSEISKDVLTGPAALEEPVPVVRGGLVTLGEGLAEFEWSCVGLESSVADDLWLPEPVEVVKCLSGFPSESVEVEWTALEPFECLLLAGGGLPDPVEVVECLPGWPPGASSESVEVDWVAFEILDDLLLCGPAGGGLPE